MMRRWVGTAVIAGCLCLVQAARAQFSPPPAGPDAPPEPIPFSPSAPSGGPNLIPGPINPQIAPQGPCADYSLPNDGTGAFPCKEVEPECAPFFHVGAQMWMRERLASGTPIAVQDPVGLDTGAAPPPNSPVLQQFNDVNPHFGAGPRATVGYLFNGNEAFEVSGFYTFESNATAALLAPGRIDSFFINPPLDFEGDNGMWLQADRMTTTLSTTLWGAEANYRYTDAAVTGAELIVGARYLDLDERLTTVTDDDGIQFPMTNGQPDPTRVAAYSVRTHNRLVGPQLGFEYDRNLACFLSLGIAAKGAWGADFVQLDRSLVRGDGFVGFTGRSNETQFAQMYEFNAFVDFHILERLNLRIGYNTLWFLNMANVVDQYDFNLQNTSNFNNRNGSVFFHGPMAELQFLF